MDNPYNGYSNEQLNGGYIMTTWKKRTIGMDLLGFMFGRFLITGMNPVGFAYYLCMYTQETGKGFLVVALLLGMATKMEWTEVFKYALAMGTVTIIYHLMEHTGRRVDSKARGIIGGFVVAAMSLTHGILMPNYRLYIVLAALEGILVFIFSYLMQKGITYLLSCKKGEGVSNQELISIGIMLGFIIYSLPTWTYYDISLPRLIVCLLVLLAGYKYGSGVGAVIGAACGIAVSFQGNEVTLIGIMCILGICAGMFQEIGKWGAAICYLVTGISLGFLYEKTLINMSGLKDLLCGVFFFLVLPNFICRPVHWETSKNGDYIKQNLQMITKNKFRDFSEALGSLSKSFNGIAKPRQMFSYEEVNGIFENVSEQFCKDCTRCEECWNRNYQTTYDSTQEIFSVAKEKGMVREEDVPFDFMKRCINVKAFVRETNKSLEIAKVNLDWYNRLTESREAVADQLNEMAQVMKEFAEDVCGMKEVKNDVEEQIMIKLQSHHIDIKRIVMVENRQKRTEIHLIARMRRGRCVTSREVAVLLGQVLGKRMRPAEHTKNVVPKEAEPMVFVEDTQYKTITGVARKTKDGEEVSGDNFSFLELDSGEMIMMLSDGMGSGEAANQESEAVIDLLERMMEAGLREKAAINLINSLYVLQSESRSFSTIDMGILDLFEGSCDFIKLGAATTFIKRNNKLVAIESTSLPAGMFQKIEVESEKTKLKDGDYIIMVSDGVLDCFPSEEKTEYMEFLLSEIKSNSPQEIANQLLYKIEELEKKSRSDDMTILVAGVWKKN